MMIGPFMMAGMFYYFGDGQNKTLSGLQTFPRNIISMAEHLLTKTGVPYIPGAPFLMAAFFAAIAFGTYILVTNKADREARYEANTAMNSEAAE